MNYTVVIVTYNRLDLLKECLGCVDSQVLKFHSIVIVDNCSTDGTSEFLAEYSNRREDVVLITTEKNIGGSGGFALGIKNIPPDSDYVLLIDDDAMLDFKFLQEISKHMENEVLAYAGTVYTEGMVDTSHRRRIRNRILMTKADVPIQEYEEESFMFDLATFCGLMVNKNVIDKIGLPRGEYFIWYDDTEYCYRIAEHTKIKNVNSAHINHKTKVSQTNDLSWKSYYGYRNQIDVGKHYSKIPSIYLIYRYSYHLFRLFYFSFFAKRFPDNQYYKECAEMQKQVMVDSRKEVLGISDKFYPGKKLK